MRSEKIRCPKCGAALSVLENQLDTPVFCKQCKTRIEVPREHLVKEPASSGIKPAQIKK